MKALFISPGGIGDQILLLPTIKLFKDAFPEARIDLITEPRSSCIADLSNLFRRVKTFNFKDKNPNLFEFKELSKDRKYKYLFATGKSLKANLAAAASEAEIKIGYYHNFLSKVLLNHSVKLHPEQYTSNMLAELLSPIIPEVLSIVKSKDLIPEIKINQEAIDWAKETLNPRLKERYYAKKIFIHPGVSKLSIEKNILKSYSPKYWAAVIEKLLEKEENTVILIGGKDDAETINEIHKRLTFFVRPKNFFDLSTLDLSIQKLASLINSSDLLLCVDSAPMHIGVALGKKVIAFFGPTNPKKLLPNDSRFIPAHVENLECRPCLFDKRYQSCEKPECLNLSPNKIIEYINQQLTAK